MIKLKIMITLLSDLYILHGKTYELDLAGGYFLDKFGIPIISCNFLLGMLRGSAEELVNLGILKQNLLEDLFGYASGDKSKIGRIVVSDAKLKNYDKLFYPIKLSNNVVNLKNTLKENTDFKVCVDIDKGAIKDHSLHEVILVKKIMYLSLSYMLELISKTKRH